MPRESPLRGLLPYLRRYRRAYIVGVVAVSVTATLALLAPRVLQVAVDDLEQRVTASKLAAYGGILLALALAGGVARFLMRRMIIGVSREVESEIRSDFFAHVARLPLSTLARWRTGDLMSRAMNDLESVRLMIGISVIDAFNTFIVFVVAVVLMAAIDLRLTLLALTPLPVVSVAVKFFGAAIYRHSRAVQAQLAEVSSLAQESLSAIRLVQAFGQESAMEERFAATLRAYFGRNRRLIRLQAFFYATMAFFLGLGAMLVLWVGSADVIRGRMTLGQFVAFGVYQTMLGVPMIAFGSLTNTIQRGTASWRRLLEVFDLPSVSSDRSALTSDPPGRPLRGSEDPRHGRAAHRPPERQFRPPSIEFRHLTFSHESAPSVRVLDDVSFSVAPGQIVAIVGPTGSGKSTLLSLLPRLHEPPRGTVFVDATDVRDIGLDRLRAAIGFVPQEPFLFSDTLVENIAFGRRRAERRAQSGPYTGRRAILPFRDVGDRLSGGVDLRGTGTHHLSPDVTQAVRRAAAIARLDADVSDLPAGYETALGERGMNLSGGQRQRTALARALLVDPRILVLDDPLSAVDAQTEAAILAELWPEMRRRTSLLVSNRVSTVRDADLILVLDGGRIVERGRHDELLRLDGLYARLHRRQLLSDALAAS